MAPAMTQQVERAWNESGELDQQLCRTWYQCHAHYIFWLMSVESSPFLHANTFLVILGVWLHTSSKPLTEQGMPWSS